MSPYASEKSAGATAIRTEIPSTAPSCRKQAEIAEPVANRAGDSSATAAELNPAKDSPTPVPVSNVAGKNSDTYAGDESRPVANSTQPSAKTSPPGTAAARDPYRSIIRPARALESAAISGPGVTANPASSVE